MGNRGMWVGLKPDFRSAEVGNMALPKKLLAAGVRDMVRISDARMSGTAFGTVVLHAAPARPFCPKHRRRGALDGEKPADADDVRRRPSPARCGHHRRAAGPAAGHTLHLAVGSLAEPGRVLRVL